MFCKWSPIFFGSICLDPYRNHEMSCLLKSLFQKFSLVAIRVEYQPTSHLDLTRHKTSYSQTLKRFKKTVSVTIRDPNFHYPTYTTQFRHHHSHTSPISFQCWFLTKQALNECLRKYMSLGNKDTSRNIMLILNYCYMFNMHTNMQLESKPNDTPLLIIYSRQML